MSWTVFPISSSGVNFTTGTWEKGTLQKKVFSGAPTRLLPRRAQGGRPGRERRKTGQFNLHQVFIETWYLIVMVIMCVKELFFRSSIGSSSHRPVKSSWEPPLAHTSFCSAGFQPWAFHPHLTLSITTSCYAASLISRFTPHWFRGWRTFKWTDHRLCF